MSLARVAFDSNFISCLISKKDDPKTDDPKELQKKTTQRRKTQGLMTQTWPSLTCHSNQLVDRDFVLEVGTVQLVDYTGGMSPPCE
eukprot:432116-Amphidinium_carterae.1